MPFRYHEGERRVQRRAGVVQQADWGAEHAIRPEVPPVADQFLAEQVMVVVGHRDAGGAAWASALSGAAGFVTVMDRRTVRIDATPVEADTLGDGLARGPLAVGMLAIEPETRRRMRLNGIGELRDGSLWIHTEQVYANCPKYISTRRRVQADEAATERRPARSRRLDARGRELIEQADTFFIATTHATTGADASHRGGNPGFVRVEAAGKLVWPDYRGNSMFMTLGNLELDPHAGLLFPDWDTGDVLQLSGTAHTDWDPEHAAQFPGAERVVTFTTDRVLLLPDALRWRWRLEKHSRFSPPAPSQPGAVR